MGFNNRYVPSRGHYSGTISASAFVGDGSGLTGISGSGVPGGSANHVQFNNGAGDFNGSANFTFDGTTVTASISGSDSKFTTSAVTTLTASSHISASVFYGDGSNLTGVSGGGGTPGGSNTQVQYNNGGSFTGSSNLTFNGTTLTASITGSSLEYTTAAVSTLTASTHISASTFHGDGSNLTGISAGGGSAADSDQTILAVQVFG